MPWPLLLLVELHFHLNKLEYPRIRMHSRNSIQKVKLIQYRDSNSDIFQVFTYVNADEYALHPPQARQATKGNAWRSCLLLYPTMLMESWVEGNSCMSNRDELWSHTRHFKSHKHITDTGYSCCFIFMYAWTRYNKSCVILTLEKKNWTHWTVAKWFKVLSLEEHEFCVTFRNQVKVKRKRIPKYLRCSVKFLHSVPTWGAGPKAPD